jgi:hypothetical protein
MHRAVGKQFFSLCSERLVMNNECVLKITLALVLYANWHAGASTAADMIATGTTA